MATRARFWLEDQRGNRIRVAAGGATLGRHVHCDIVFPPEERHIARLQAIVQPRGSLLEVQNLGRNPIRVADDVVHDTGDLAPGQTMEVGRFRFTARSEEVTAGVAWLLEGFGPTLVSINQTPFSIGGSNSDALLIGGWPPATLIFHLLGDTLMVETSQQVLLGDKPLAPKTLERLRGGDQLGFQGLELRLLAAGTSGSTTILEPGEQLPRRVALHFLPRGARLQVELPSGDKKVALLSELRTNLLACLLQPPGHAAPGDWLADDTILPLVWPRQHDKDRVDLNLLVFHTRKALIKAGIDGVSLLQRAPTGGALRFHLGPGAQVQVVV